MDFYLKLVIASPSFPSASHGATFTYDKQQKSYMKIEALEQTLSTA